MTTLIQTAREMLNLNPTLSPDRAEWVFNRKNIMAVCQALIEAEEVIEFCSADPEEFNEWGASERYWQTQTKARTWLKKYAEGEG